jgi:hypothetical protein
MAIYAVMMPGRRKRVLVRAAGEAEALRRFATAERLDNDGMQEAIDNGERTWREGEDFPPDEPEAVETKTAKD